MFVDLVVFIQEIDSLFYALLHNFPDRFRFVQEWFLLQETDGIARRENRLTVEVLVYTSQNLEERAFTGSIKPQDADFGAVKIGQVDVFQNGFLVVIFAYANHGVNDFIHFGGHGR